MAAFVPRMRLLPEVTRAAAAVADQDVRTVLGAGVSRAQVEEALLFVSAFKVITRPADTFQFGVASPESFDVGARHLLRRGYR